MRSKTQPALPRVLGALTAGYGVAVVVRPGLLAHPCGLTDTDGRPSTATTILTRAVGARDTASGLAMTLATGRRATVTAIGIRVACDTADTILFGLTLPEPKSRGKAARVAGGWGLLCAASALTLRKGKH